MRIVKYSIPLNKKEVRADLLRIAKEIGAPTKNVEVGIRNTSASGSHGHIRPYGSDSTWMSKRSGTWRCCSAYICLHLPKKPVVRKYFWEHGSGSRWHEDQRIDDIPAYNAMLITWIHELCHLMQKNAGRPFSEPECDQFSLHWAKELDLLPTQL